MQDNKLSILVVEDHPFQLIAAQMHLNRLGFFRLIPALDASEAREECARRSGPFDLLLCDINLPGTDGVELAIELAAAGRIRHAVLLSCREDAELRTLQQSLKARGLPILACLPKPLDQTALMQTLQDAEAFKLLEQAD
ncbi:response regulator [Pseudomonas nitroreducens]|uniref:response regulator n=1 Tax=Pseudomonas TaxID=286 RepID=UPI0002F67CB9|nr:response regulator [Pseudomonas nitroreducens]